MREAVSNGLEKGTPIHNAAPERSPSPLLERKVYSVEPALIPLLDKLAEPDSRVKAEVPLLTTAASKRDRRVGKRVMVICCIIFAGAFGNALGAGTIDKKVVSDTVRKASGLIGLSRPTIADFEVAAPAEPASKDAAHELKLASSAERPNPPPSELGGQGEQHQDGIDPLKRAISEQISELKTSNEKLREEVERLAEALLRLERHKLDAQADRTKDESAVNPAQVPDKRGDSRRSISAQNNSNPRTSAPRANTRVAAASAPASVPSATSGEAISIEHYSLRRVINGVAVLQDRTNSFEVTVGDDIPGLGPVQSISRHGNRWFVQTAKGTIMSR